MSSKEFDEAYEKLRANGEATVKNIVEWMKRAQLLERANQTEEAAAEMFKDIKDNKEVPLDTFKVVMQDLANQAKMTSAEMLERMMKASDLVMEALIAAGTAFSSTLTSQQSQPQTSKK